MVGKELPTKEISEGTWDVLVVGAGPAGSRAAEAAAKGGAERVLIFEKRKEVGLPVQCAEFLHRKVVDELGPPSDIIKQRISGMVTHVWGGAESATREPGCILDRAALDRWLALRAEKAGAVLLLDSKAHANIFLENRYWAIEGFAYKRKVGVTARGKVFIGADGPNSLVCGWTGQVNKETIVAHQVTVELLERSDKTEVFLHPDFPGGYGWLFPKGDVANIGVGVDLDMGGEPKMALKALLGMVGDRIGAELATTGGVIPVGGPVNCNIKNLLLCGDAGGFTHPISGGGIHQAVTTGEFAGKAAARYVKGDIEAFDWYVEECERLFGRNLRHAVDRRKEMVAGWKDACTDEAAFEKLMRRCWIGFKGYNRP